MTDRNMMTIWLVIFTESMKYKTSLLFHQTLCQGDVGKAKESAGMMQAGNKQEAGRGLQWLVEPCLELVGAADVPQEWHYS